MFCNQCGKQLPDGTKFCSFCGANLTNPAAGESPAQPQQPQQNVQQPMQQPQQAYQQPQYAQPQQQQPYQQQPYPNGQQPYQQYGQPYPNGQGYPPQRNKMPIFKQKWFIPAVAGVVVLALVIGFLHPFSGKKGGSSKLEESYEALCSMTSLGTQSYLYARMLTERLLETDIATGDPDEVKSLFTECLDAWKATGEVTDQINTIAAALTGASGLSGLKSAKATAKSLLPMANAAYDDAQAAAISETLSPEDSILRCTQLGTQLGADATSCYDSIRQLQSVYSGRSTSLDAWESATASAADSLNTVVFLSGEIIEGAGTTGTPRSVHTISNSMKPGGLALENTDIVVDVGERGATIVMGQGNGVSMNRDDIEGSLPRGDSSVITITTYPENPNDVTITFHGTSLDDWLIVGRLGGFRITRGDKDDGNPVTPPEIIGGDFDPGDMTPPDISREFEHVTTLRPPETPRENINNWTPPINPDDTRREIENINNNNNNNNNDNNNPPPGPVDVGTLNERLVHEGAGQGTITVSMLWGTHDDLDLHMNTPDGGHIFYSNKTAGGGTLDIDMNASSSNLTTSPIENIYFPSPEDGHYKVYLRDYRDRTDGQSTHYLVRVIVNGEERVFEGDIDQTGTEIVIYEFDYVGPEEVQPQPPTETDLVNRLTNAGAGVGDITVSLAWNTWDDVDLHVIAPGDKHIYYSNKTAGGGTLDVDANAGGQRILDPVENIYFAAPQNGHYKVYINDYSDRTEGTTNYIVRISVGDQSQTFSGTIDTTGTDIDIFEFDYGGAGDQNQDIFNGHRYAMYDENGQMSWTQARAYCQSLGGHLVAINSAEEQEFLERTYGNAGMSPWIGIYGSGSSWNWVTGEPVEYTHWASSQPDNANGDEWFGHIWGSSSWNDLNNDDSTYHYHKGFICEWDGIMDESRLDEGLTDAGALTGAITISLGWDSGDDLDLHVFTPNGSEIYYNNPSADGGTLDVDANAYSSNLSSNPVENVYFEEPAAGEYWVYIYNYADRTPDGVSNYIVRVKIGDQSKTFSGTIASEDESIEIMGFTYGGSSSR